MSDECLFKMSYGIITSTLNYFHILIVLKKKKLQTQKRCIFVFRIRMEFSLNNRIEACKNVLCVRFFFLSSLLVFELSHNLNGKFRDNK